MTTFAFSSIFTLWTDTSLVDRDDGKIRRKQFNWSVPLNLVGAFLKNRLVCLFKSACERLDGAFL